jgi:SAM-dependent MidA family methyltransferase
VIFANELLDALPTHVVAMSDGGLREVFIDDRDGRSEVLRSRPRRGLLTTWLAPAPRCLQDGVEVNLAAED